MTADDEPSSVSGWDEPSSVSGCDEPSSVSGWDEPSSVSGWTAPNVDAALPQADNADEWRPVRGLETPGPSSRPLDQQMWAPAQQMWAPAPAPPVGRRAHLPSLPGVDLPTRLPEPQPAPLAGLGAHKPGVAPLRPLRVLDVVSGAVSVGRGNAATIALMWLCTWVPAGAIVAGAFLGGPGPGRVALSVAAFVAPVILTGLLAAPLHATAIGQPMAVPAAMSAIGRRFVPSTAVGAVGILVLAAPALLLGLTVAAVTAFAALSPLVLVLPLLIAVPLSVYLLAAAPIQMVQTVVAVEGAPLGASIRRALGLTGKGLGHQLLPIVLQAILFSTIGFALFMSVGRIFLRGAPTLVILVTAAVVSPIAAGFAVMSYLDARVRQEAYDVELLATEAGR